MSALTPLASALHSKIWPLSDRHHEVSGRLNNARRLICGRMHLLIYHPRSHGQDRHGKGHGQCREARHLRLRGC